MALSRRTVLVALGAALGGCTAPATTSDTPVETDDTATPTDSKTDSETPTATEPAYLDCDRATIAKDLPQEATATPDPLTEDSVLEYVKALEEYLTLPLEDGEPDGYVSIGTIEIERVEYGYLATVPVTGGYYNQEQDDSTETVHADLAPYTATYFVNEQVVRRAEDSNSELDPRDYGDVVVCESD
jgi:hypothetical protein